jgi:hypothetical protein
VELVELHGEIARAYLRTNRYWDPGITVDLIWKNGQKLKQERHSGRIPSEGVNHILNAVMPLG